jgi:nuclear cap-binding protein subunit 1
MIGETRQKEMRQNFGSLQYVSFHLKSLANGEEAQACVLRAVGDLWRSHHQMMVMLVDKLLKTQVVECAAVANWIFSKEMVQDFTKLYVWEMLHLTIRYVTYFFAFYDFLSKGYPQLSRKMNKHVNKLNKEATDMRKQIEDSDNSDNSDDSDNEDKMVSPRYSLAFLLLLGENI